MWLFDLPLRSIAILKEPIAILKEPIAITKEPFVIHKLYGIIAIFSETSNSVKLNNLDDLFRDSDDFLSNIILDCKTGALFKHIGRCRWRIARFLTQFDFL